MKTLMIILFSIITTFSANSDIGIAFDLSAGVHINSDPAETEVSIYDPQKQSFDLYDIEELNFLFKQGIGLSLFYDYKNILFSEISYSKFDFAVYGKFLNNYDASLKIYSNNYLAKIGLGINLKKSFLNRELILIPVILCGGGYTTYSEALFIYGQKIESGHFLLDNVPLFLLNFGCKFKYNSILSLKPSLEIHFRDFKTKTINQPDGTANSFHLGIQIGLFFST